MQNPKLILVSGALALALAGPQAARGAPVLDDAMQGSTTGTRSGGRFVAGGWQVTGKNDTIYWHLPTIAKGAAEFDVRGLQPKERRAGMEDKSELFHMYDHTVGNADSNYTGGYRENPFKHFIRKIGALDAAKVDAMEIVWQIRPKYEEPDTARLPWASNATYRFREEWGPDGAGNSVLKLYRNGELLLRASVPGPRKPAGLSVRIGASPRRDPTAGAPVGAVFSNVKVWDLAKGTGLVRLEGKSFCDDAGPFLGLGASYFQALRHAKYDRKRLNGNLALLSSPRKASTTSASSAWSVGMGSRLPRCASPTAQGAWWKPGRQPAGRAAREQQRAHWSGLVRQLGERPHQTVLGGGVRLSREPAGVRLSLARGRVRVRALLSAGGDDSAAGAAPTSSKGSPMKRLLLPWCCVVAMAPSVCLAAPNTEGASVRPLPTGGTAGRREASVPRYGVFEAALTASKTYANPFLDVTVRATFTAPSGRKLTAYGFYDGGTTWRVRLAPDEAGQWHYATEASDTADGGLHGRTGTFRCGPSADKGFIRVDPKREYYFSYSGGTPEKPDYDRLNPAYFQRYERILGELKRRRVHAEIIVLNVYEVPFKAPALWTRAREELWTRYVVSRLSAYSTVFLWTVAQEYERYPAGFRGTTLGVDNAEIYYDRVRRFAPFRVADSGHVKQLQHLYDFAAKRTAFRDMNPAQGLVNPPNLCLADPGAEYVVYAPAGGEVGLDLAQAAGSFSVGWLDPRTGAYEGRALVSGGAQRAFAAPDASDWVLHLKKAEGPSRWDWQQRLARAARWPESWRARREEIRRQILVAAGLWPEFQRPPLDAVVTNRIERQDYTLQNVYLQTWPGLYLTGSLYSPKRPGPLPAVLCTHGHGKNGRFGPQEEQPRAITLARLGFVVFSYDMVGYGDCTQLAHEFGDPSSGLNLLGLQLWNSLCVVDYVASLPSADPKRIGVTGSSGGGTQTYLLAAVDDRIACAAPVCMAAAEFQGGCACENAPSLRIGLCNVEIAAAAAPRPLLLVAATGDWTKHSPALEGPAIQRAYEALGVADRFRCVQFEAPHNYNRDSREVVYAWFARWLQNAPDARRLQEPSLEVEPRENLTVFTAAHPRPKDSVDAAGLANLLKQKIARQLDAMWPKDAGSLQRFRRTMTPALRDALGVKWAGPEEIEATTTQPAAEAGSLSEISIRQPGVPGAIELLSSAPAAGEHRATLLVAPATHEIDPALQGVRHAGDAIFVLRLKPHGRETVSGGTVEQRREFPSTYYRTALAWQVQDVLTALAYLTRREGASDVRLVGLGEAGIPTLLARALEPAGKVSLTIADLAGMDDPDERTWTGPRTQAGMLRLGGLRTAAILAAPGELILHNTGAHLDVAPIRAAYRAVGRESALEVSGPLWSIDKIRQCLGVAQAVVPQSERKGPAGDRAKRPSGKNSAFSPPRALTPDPSPETGEGSSCWTAAESPGSAPKPLPIRLHPDNPHYFLWRGKPAVLIASGEHYGAAMNRDFDYVRYLDELKARRFNLTRAFSGTYREVAGSFNITGNTLAPAPGRYLCPWSRSSTPGASDGGNKLDLTKWDPAYFERLKDFVAQAGQRGVVVELVLFCTMYDENVWNASPMNARNNTGVASRARYAYSP
jgi:dienelactone hydrolase